MIRWDRTRGKPEPIAALNRIREVDNGEPLVDILKIVPRIRLARPAVVPYLRETVALKLKAAAESLPEGIQFGVIDCFRPLARQQRIYDFMFANAQAVHPERTHAALRRTVCRWVAPTNQKAPPGHCTGAAIDLQLEDLDGVELDICSPYDRYSSAPTYCLGLSEVAQKNRDLLLKVMLDAGFSNCRDEWWHYSYGDAGWAVRSGQTECFYALATLDPALYAEKEILHAESLIGRPNPFLSFPRGR